MKRKPTSTKIERMNNRWKKEKLFLVRKQEIAKEKAEILEPKTRLSTTKRYMVFIFGTATIIELFTGYLMIHQMYLAQLSIMNGMGNYTPDMGPQTVLISTVVAEVIAFAVYCAKATKEKTVGGIEYLEAEQRCDG